MLALGSAADLLTPFRHESRGAEMTAGRRAAAFLDGGVFGGGPPG
jgi:hypothetical protein